MSPERAPQSCRQKIGCLKIQKIWNGKRLSSDTKPLLFVKDHILRWKPHLAIGSEGTFDVLGAGAAVVAFSIFRLFT